MAKNRRRILVADDEDYLLNIICHSLEWYGFEVEKAENGEEALSILKNAKRPFDVLITDFNMPVMNGEALIRAIYREGLVLKGIILCSGGNRNPNSTEIEDFLAEFIHAIPFRFVPKPFGPPDLLAAIKDVLQIYR